MPGSAASDGAEPASAPVSVPGVPAPDSVQALADSLRAEIAALRGWTFRSPVGVAVTTEDELGAYLTGRLGEEYAPGELKAIEQFLQLTGILPDTVDFLQTATDLLLAQVEGFYDPALDTYFLVERSEKEGALWKRLVMVHELGHALDDQVVDLDSLLTARERTQDGEFVTGALTEGSATALMTRYLARDVQGNPVSGLELMNEVGAAEWERDRAFNEAPAYFHTLLAHYVCGLGFLVGGDYPRLIAAGVGDRFLRAVGDPPESSEQILHPERYWDSERRDPPVRADDAATEAVLSEAGWRVRHRDTAGEALMAIVTRAPSTLSPVNSIGLEAWTTPAATGWGGDRFYLVESVREDAGTTAGSAGVWITAWDRPADREEFALAYRGKPVDAFDVGQRVRVYVFGMSSGDAATLRGALTSDTLRFTRGDSPWDALGTVD